MLCFQFFHNLLIGSCLFFDFVKMEQDRTGEVFYIFLNMLHIYKTML